MTVNWLGLVFPALMFLVWPVVVFVSAKFVKRRTFWSSTGSAAATAVASTFVGIAVADAVSTSRYRAAGGWLFPLLWMSVPLLWLLLAVIRARRPRP